MQKLIRVLCYDKGKWRRTVEAEIYPKFKVLRLYIVDTRTWVDISEQEEREDPKKAWTELLGSWIMGEKIKKEAWLHTARCKRKLTEEEVRCVRKQMLLRCV